MLPPFVTSNRGYLLDLICSRYPGSKPSDYFEELDDYQKFELDAALAVKHSLLEQDERLDMVEAIQASIKSVVQSQFTKKLPKDKPRKRLVRSPEELLSGNTAKQDDTGAPLIIVKRQLMSTGTTILEKV